MSTPNIRGHQLRTRWHTRDSSESDPVAPMGSHTQLKVQSSVPSGMHSYFWFLRSAKFARQDPPHSTKDRRDLSASPPRLRGEGTRPARERPRPERSPPPVPPPQASLPPPPPPPPPPPLPCFRGVTSEVSVTRISRRRRTGLCRRLPFYGGVPTQP